MTTSISLHPHQALALVNRWAKLKGYFYYDDTDFLYAIKDAKIREWTGREMNATRVVRRQNPTLIAMQQTINNKGASLDAWYDLYGDIEKIPDDVPLQALWDLTENGVELSLKETPEYQEAFAIYQDAVKQYRREMARRKPIQDEYNKQQQSWNQKQIHAALEWAKEKGLLTILPKNKGKKQKWLNRAIQAGFVFDKPAPSKPKFEKFPQPTPPAESYYVHAQEYEIGMNEEVDKAIEWMKTFAVEQGYEVEDYKTWDDSVPTLVETHYRELRETSNKAAVLKIMQDAIDGKLTPREIWSRLTSYGFDYENAIGMECGYDFRNSVNFHKDFGKWHEINFSQTGYWLVEFQSNIHPEVVLHVPYDRAGSVLSAEQVAQLPQEDSEQEHFGRAISTEEQNQYPLNAVLEILGYSSEDFPYGLEKYKPRQRYHPYQGYDNGWNEGGDEGEDDEMDEEGWLS